MIISMKSTHCKVDNMEVTLSMPYLSLSYERGSISRWEYVTFKYIILCYTV